MKPTADSCDCGVFLAVTNQCAGVVNATDFQFTNYGPEGESPTAYQCPVLQPGDVGAEILSVAVSSGTGTKTWTLHLQESGVTSALTINATVMSFGGAGCACAPPSRPSDAEGLPLLIAGGTSVVLAVRARRPRAPRNYF